MQSIPSKANFCQLFMNHLRKLSFTQRQWNFHRTSSTFLILLQIFNFLPKPWTYVDFSQKSRVWRSQRVNISPIVDLRRKPEGTIAPPRKETANRKAHKLFLEGAKIIETTWKWPWTTISEGAKIVGPLRKSAFLLSRARPYPHPPFPWLNHGLVYRTTHNFVWLFSDVYCGQLTNESARFL